MTMSLPMLANVAPVSPATNPDPERTAANGPATALQPNSGASEPTRNPTTVTNTPGPVSAYQPAVEQPAGLEPIRDWRTQAGMTLIESGRLVEGRALLSQVLVEQGDRLPPADARAIRDTLTHANETLIFSPGLANDDPIAEPYTIQSGDLLSKIAPRYHTTYQFLELINRINARRIRPGQKIKVIKGPFHAVVDKSDFRMDIFIQGPDGSEIYVRSFPVGLGEDNSTPLGNWVVRRGSKMANPSWTNPRTGVFYGPDDPKNPIGEYWMGLEGAEDRTRDLAGYGIHGTIEPESIGTAASMGCVRLRDDDVALVYKLLVESASTVTIQP